MWDIVFDGNPDHMHIEEFVFRIEYLQKRHNCSWADIMRDFHRLLKGDARESYWDIIRSKRINTWEELKRLLYDEFMPKRSKYEYLRDLEERYQGSGESIDSYILTMKKLRARVRPPIEDYEMIRILKKNVREDIGSIIYGKTIYTVVEFRDEYNTIKRDFVNREKKANAQTKRFGQYKKSVDEIYEESREGENMVDVDEVRYQHKPNKKTFRQNDNHQIICWNCKVQGHMFKLCPEKRALFCFKCGKPGVITPECPKCTENGMKSVKKAGESRSTQTPDE